jgi:hypothetical protein
MSRVGRIAGLRAARKGKLFQEVMHVVLHDATLSDSSRAISGSQSKAGIAPPSAGRLVRDMVPTLL